MHSYKGYSPLWRALMEKKLAEKKAEELKAAGEDVPELLSIDAIEYHFAKKQTKVEEYKEKIKALQKACDYSLNSIESMGRTSPILIAEWRTSLQQKVARVQLETVEREATIVSPEEVKKKLDSEELKDLMRFIASIQKHCRDHREMVKATKVEDENVNTTKSKPGSSI